MTTSCDSSDSSSTQSNNTLTAAISASLDTLTCDKNTESQNLIFSQQFNEKASCLKDFDVPFFTVARYRNPKSPTTFEIAAVTPLENYDSNKRVQESVQYFENIYTNTSKPEKEPEYNGISNFVPKSPSESSLTEGSETTKEWLGKSFNISYPTTDDLQMKSQENSVSITDSIKPDTGCSNTVLESLNNSFDNSNAGNGNNHYSKVKKYDATAVRGFINFFENTTTKVLRRTASQGKRCVSRRVSTPITGSESVERNSKFTRSLIYRKNSLTEESSIERNFFTETPKKYEKPAISSSNETKRGAYEDARVTDAAEKLENRPSTPLSNSNRNNRKNPTNTSCREKNNIVECNLENGTENNSEYMTLLHEKIAQSHQRQLLPLQEDLADWLSNLLGANLTSENLISKLENGILLCQLADLISAKAQEARDKSLSSLEVPSLPYKIWKQARSGTFFARDNISNFLRFCRRLGVHSNLLFETEDLVCGSGVRRVVLCLLEIGRLAHLWWNVDPPGLVKLEREFDKKNFNQRSESAESIVDSKIPPQVPKKVPSTTTTASDARPHYYANGVKPIPPPKPASISKAVACVTKRPRSFATSSTPHRGWSGAQTTPATPLETPTHSFKTRLPVAKTPMSSGKCTPNTTPTTPTQSRRYLVSTQRNNDYASKIPTRTIISKAPLQCSKMKDSMRQMSKEELSKESNLDLDKQVSYIVEQTKGFCSCKDKECGKHHIKKISDGIYDFHGKNVFVRLLKGKHVMVRVGGGWDTLDHYLIRHDPTQTKFSKLKSPSSYQGAAKFRSQTCSSESARLFAKRSINGCNNSKEKKDISKKSSTVEERYSAVDRVLFTQSDSCLKKTSVASRDAIVHEISNDHFPENSLSSSMTERMTLSDSVINSDDCTNVDSDKCDHLHSHMQELWSCDLSAPMGVDGNFQSTSFPLDDMLMASSQSLDLV